MLRCLRRPVRARPLVAAAAALTALVAFTAAPRAARAFDWIVAPTGAPSTTRDCGTARTGTPLESIAAAVACVNSSGADGDRIVLRAGDHVGFVAADAMRQRIAIVPELPRAARIVEPPPIMFPNMPLVTLVHLQGWMIRGVVFAPRDAAPTPTTVPRSDIAVESVDNLLVQDNVFNGGTGVVVTQNSANVRVLDNRFEPAWGAAIAVGVATETSAADCHGGMIARNVIARVLPADVTAMRVGFATGIVLSKVSAIDVVNNAVLNVAGAGILITAPMEGSASVGNVVHNTVITYPGATTAAIDGLPFVALDASVASLRNNIFFGPAGRCIYGVTAGTLPRLGPSSNNVFATDSSDTCFATDATGAMTYTFAQYQATAPSREAGAIRAARASVVDPMTARLYAGSPAINAGALLTPPVTDDFRGLPRWDGQPDIGCHEINAESAPMPDGGVDGGAPDASATDGAAGDGGRPPDGDGASTQPGDDAGTQPGDDGGAGQVPPGLRFRGGGCACTATPGRGASVEPGRSPAGRARSAASLLALAVVAGAGASARRRARQSRLRAVR